MIPPCGRRRLPTALLLLAVSAPCLLPWRSAAADGLGRLFFTPQQRDRLDELRDTYVYGQPQKSRKAPTIQDVTINGVVLRSDGESAAWINGSPVFGAQATPEGVQVEADHSAGGGVRIRLPGGVDTVQLKPGQKIDLPDGRVLDAYQHLPTETSKKVFEGGDQPQPEPAERPKPGGGGG